MSTFNQFKKYQIKDLGNIKGGSEDETTEECTSLKKGYVMTNDLQDWWDACRRGVYDRRDIS